MREVCPRIFLTTKLKNFAPGLFNFRTFFFQALVKQGSDFSGRPDIKLYTQILGKDGILFADYDKKFKTQKKFMVNVLKKYVECQNL